MPSYDYTDHQGKVFTLDVDEELPPDQVYQRFAAAGIAPEANQMATTDAGYLSQLGSALSIGARQMMSGVKATFNAATGDVADTAEAMAKMGALQNEQQSNLSPEDVALNEAFEKNKADYDRARGILPTIGALSGYVGSIASNPGAAFKQAVQSAPNAVISAGTGLAGYALGGLLGAGAGVETGPGAILTGIAGAAAGGAVSNSLMEAGPAIYDILNERTNGAASSMTADQITQVLQQNPDIMSEGLKTGAIRGSVIGVIEGLGMKGAGRLMSIPERAAARAAQKTLIGAGVDVASNEAVETALLDPALKSAVSLAAKTAKDEFTSTGNLARLAGAAGLEIGTAGAGEVGAQVAMGQEIDPTAAVQEMMGEVGLSIPVAAVAKGVELAETMQNPGLTAAVETADNLVTTAVDVSPDVSKAAEAALNVIQGVVDSTPTVTPQEAPAGLPAEPPVETPSPTQEQPEQSSQTITDSNGEIAPEMSVPPPTAEAGAGVGEAIQTPKKRGRKPALAPQAQEMLAQAAAINAGEQTVAPSTNEFVQKMTGQQPTPQGAMPTPATEGKVMPGGSAMERDVSLRDTIASALDADDVGSAILLTNTEKKDVLERELAAFIPVGNAKTAKELRERFAAVAPRITKSATTKARLESNARSAEAKLRTTEDKQQRHLDGLLGPPISDVSKDLATDAEQSDPHGIGKEAVASMWQAEVDDAKARYEKAATQLQDYLSSSVPAAESKATATKDSGSAASETAKVATVKSTELRIGDEVSFKGNTYRVKNILSDGRVRAEFTNPEGIAKLPAGSVNITTLPRNVNFTRIDKQSPQTTASETQTPATSRKVAGASGSVQSEPAEGSIPAVKPESPVTAIESTEKTDVAKEAMSFLEADLTEAQRAKWTPEMFTAAQAFFDSGGKDFDSLKKAIKFPRVVQQAYLKADKDAAAEQSRREADDAALAREVERAAKEQVKAEAAELKRKELMSKTLNSLIEKTRTNVVQGAVKPADAQQAISILNKSGEIPNVLFTWIGTSKDFLADPANQARYPETWKAVSANSNIEGMSENGQPIVFTDNVGVSDLDRKLANLQGTTPEVAAVRRVILHENIHKGMFFLNMKEKMKLFQFLHRLYSPEELDQLAKSYDEYADWRTNQVSYFSIIEEAMTRDFDSMVEIPRDGIWAEFMQFLREIWQKITGKTGEPKLKDYKDVFRLIRNSLKNSEKVNADRLKNGGAVRMSMSEFISNVTPEQDAAYMAAVEAGDMETAQRMVDEAASKANYDVELPLIHHTFKDFTVFNPGGGKRPYGEGGWSGKAIWLEPEAEHKNRFEGDSPPIWHTLTLAAKENGWKKKAEALANMRSMRLYAKMLMPLGGTDADWRETLIPQYGLGKEFPRLVKDSDLDIMRNIRRDSAYIIGGDGKIKEVIVFDPNQLKSADPVTRDAEGNVIPLSRRFQSASPDIRFSKVGKGLSALFPRQTTIQDAYRSASQGQSSQFISLTDVFAKAKEANPSLTEEAFKADVMRLYDSGAIYLEGANSQQEAEAASLSIPGTSVGTAVRIAVPPPMASKVEFDSPNEVAFNSGAEVARNTNYDERDKAVRSAIRAAYDLAPKDNGPSVPLDQLFSIAKQSMPDLTEAEFSQILQDLYEDSGALLQAGESPFIVTTPDGQRAGSAIIFSSLQTEAMASTIDPESAASKAFAKDIQDIENGSLQAAFAGRQFKDFKPIDRTVKPAKSYQETAIGYVNNLEKEGASLEEIANSVISPAFLESIGIEQDLMAQDALGIEVRNRVNNAYRKEKNPVEKRKLQKLDQRMSAFWQGVGSKKGAHLGQRSYLVSSPRYSWMFMRDMAEKEMKERRDNIINVQFGEDNATSFTQNSYDASDRANQQAAEDVAGAAESAQEGDLDAELLRDGEATLEAKQKTVWEKVKDAIRTKALIAKALEAMRARKAGNQAKASISEEARNAIFQMTEEELLALDAKMDKVIADGAKTFLGEEAAADTTERRTVRKKREKMVDVAKKRADKGMTLDALDSDSALAKMLREINKARRGAEVPLKNPIPWRKLLSQDASTVEEYRQRIFDAISANEELQSATPEQKARLADLFSEAWESNRKRILDGMLERMIREQEAKKNLSAKGAKALQEQRMRIVEDINLGVFDNDELAKIMAEKFGIKSEFTDAEREKIESLIEILQDEKLNRVKRNKAAYELLETLSAQTDIPIAKLLANFWVSSVLSGMNTVFSIGMSVFSGMGELTTALSRIFISSFSNQKQIPSELAAAFKTLARVLSAVPRQANRAWQYLVTGDQAFLDPSMSNALENMDWASIGKNNQLAEQMARSDKILEKSMGLFMRTVSRLLTALDLFNSGLTKEGSLSIVFRQLDLGPEAIAMLEKRSDLKAYKAQVIQDYFGNVAPKTAREKALVDSYAMAEMMKALDEIGAVSENADQMAMQGAMTLDPSGVGGYGYRAVKSLMKSAETGADKLLERNLRKWDEAQTPSDKAEAFVKLGLSYLFQFAAYNAANLVGVRFARFAGNKFNQSLSFLPVLGALRLYEAEFDSDRVRGKEAFTDMIKRNQLMGVIFAAIGYQFLKDIADEPDDEERGWFINGGWSNLTPEKKQQKLADGQKEYTLGFGDTVINYGNWPGSGIIAAIGSLSDLIRFSPEQWSEKTVPNKLLSATTSGVFSALEVPALSQFQELFGSSLSSKDPNEQKLTKFARVLGNYAGGFMPRILKDLDFMADPNFRKYETLWEKTASHIPVYRRYEGKEYYDILGQQIQRKIYPGSREFMTKPTDPAYKVLGALNSRGIWLTPANAEHRMVGKGARRRKLTQEEADSYGLETGRGYKQMLLRYGQRALQMPTERARDFLLEKANDVRDKALKKVYRGYTPAS